MTMNFLAENQQDTKPQINIVSLIDVVLLLLVFFMLTTNFVLQSGIEVKLPEAKPAVKESVAELTVTIKHNNKLYLNQQPIKLEELADALKKKLAAHTGDKLLIIRADKRVQHGKVVRVMDLAKGVGIERLAIATQAGTAAP
jgi:biopolymer transport protein ExbD